MKAWDLILAALKWLAGLDEKDAEAVKAAKAKAREVQDRTHPKAPK